MNHQAIFRNLYIGFISISYLICSQHAVAQSIIGKWNQVTVKQYLTDEGAKKYGKLFIVTDMSSIGTVVSEFKSNHTYITSSGTLQGGESRTYSGSWSLDGNALTMTDQKGTNAVQSTVTVKSGTLVMETLRPDSKITRKVEITFTRGL
jgi:Lipocalin-like domain